MTLFDLEPLDLETFDLRDDPHAWVACIACHALTTVRAMREGPDPLGVLHHGGHRLRCEGRP